MQEILAQQRNTAKPITGKSFFLGVISMVVHLAIAQAVVNLIIVRTGFGLINIVFYLYAIWLIVAFMGKTVAGSLYMIKEQALYLQKTLGDSTTSVVEIPLDQILSVREVLHGERLECSYQHITVIDMAAAKRWRMRWAFALSLLSARLCRKAAGKLAMEHRAYLVAYMAEGKRCACVFMPDEAFCAELNKALPDVYGVDERTQENTRVTMMAQALERAFPALYGYVKPLVTQESIEKAREEIAAQKQKRANKKDTINEEMVKQEEAGNSDEVQDDTL